MSHVLIVNRADGSLSALPDKATFARGGFVTDPARVVIIDVEVSPDIERFAWENRHEVYVDLGNGLGPNNAKLKVSEGCLIMA